MMRVSYFLIILALLTVNSTDGAETSATVLAKFKAAGEIYRNQLRQVAGGAALVDKSGSGAGEKEIQIAAEFRIDWPKVLVHRTLHIEKDPTAFGEDVRAVDGESLFFARREQKDAPFVISSFSWLKEPLRPGQNDFYNNFDRYLFAPILVSSLAYDDLVKHPQFSADRVEKLSNGDFRLDYTLNDPALVYGSGSIELGETTGWLIRKSECRLGSLTSKRRCETTVQYGLDRQGGRVPEFVEIKHWPITGASFASGQFRLTKLESATTPAEDFTPRKYGLADLSKLARRRSSISISQVCLVGAPVLLVIAVILRSWAARKNQQNQRIQA